MQPAAKDWQCIAPDWALPTSLQATLAAVNSAELERQLRESRERVAARQKGVDIMVVMDLTGSMVGVSVLRCCCLHAIMC